METGSERRAFGEFVGPHGELAHYAFGWAAGADSRLTIGIAAGTFHAGVSADEDGYAFSLVDEPFEQVPQGGPDLTAAQAREHPDLPFAWRVADDVMRLDRRGWWMGHWLLGTRAIQMPQVLAGEEPILLVVNDAADELWQLIGTTDGGPEGQIAHLHHAVDHDPTLLDVLDLAPGQSALREHPGGPWTRGGEPPDPAAG